MNLSRTLLLLALATPVFAGDFSGSAGLQLYSLREMMKTDLPGALDRAKAFGFKEVEGGGFIPAPPEKVAEMLKERGLVPVSTHFSFKPLAENLDQCVKDAQTLGVKYAVCPWIDHKGDTFGDADVQKAAEVFNRAGEAFKKVGVSFCYHTHGYEFRPVAEGSSETYFDRLVAATKPEFVNFEMDVLWVFFPGVDPAKLLEKYGSRWQLMHLKDLRKGVKTASSPATPISSTTSPSAPAR
jgi:sugar phosphate isomerase/epimerase